MPSFDSGVDYTVTDAITAPYDRSASHPNPAFDFLTGFVPRKLKDLFKWCEYLAYNSAHIYAAQKKFGELVVTEIEYNTPNEALRKKWRHLYEKTLKIKQALMMALLDFGIYGNHFTSIYQPFVRYLKCPDCEYLVNIEHINYKFDLKKLEFKYGCPKCKRTASGKVIDRKLIAPERLNIIRWDPKRIDIEYNPVSGMSRYFYNIPQELKDKVKLGTKHLINTMPREILEAIRDNHVFEFERGKLFHMKAPAPSGIEQQWGLPSLATTIKLFLHTMTLRKANEAIALEHITPHRVVSPAQAAGGLNPYEHLSMGNWREEFKQNHRRWRRDPLHISISPIPVAVTNVGGDGRAMLTLGEVQESNKELLAAMGIPQEFLYGGLTKAGMEGTLRLIENQLQSQADQCNTLLQWFTDCFAKFLGWEVIETSLTPLKMVDDTEVKNLVIGMAMPANGGAATVSMTTAMEKMGLKLDDEREKILQETLDNLRHQQKVTTETQKLQNTLSQQVLQQIQGAAGLNYDQQAVLGKAEEIVQQLAQVDPGTRKSMLHDLQVEDLIMYAVVIQRWEDFQRVKQRDVAAQAGAEGAV